MKTLADKPRKAARVNKQWWDEVVTLRALVKALKRKVRNQSRAMNTRGV